MTTEIKDPNEKLATMLMAGINSYAAIDYPEIQHLMELPIGIQPASCSKATAIYRLVLKWEPYIVVETTIHNEDGSKYLPTVKRCSIEIISNVVEMKTDKINEGGTGVGTIIDHFIYEVMRRCEMVTYKRAGHWSGMAIGPVILASCNRIAQNTRRGAGNHIIGNSMMIDEAKKCFADNVPFTYSVVDHIEDNVLIVGYKGGNGQIDTGIIVSPYELRNAKGKVTYGISVPETTKDYYKVLKFQ